MAVFTQMYSLGIGYTGGMVYSHSSFETFSIRNVYTSNSLGNNHHRAEKTGSMD
jgi:hypothetical protein